MIEPYIGHYFYLYFDKGYHRDLSAMTVKSEQHPSIPIIDFTPLLSDKTDDEAFFETSKDLYKAFKEVGFAYIRNHSVPEDVVEEAFEWVCCQISCY